MPEEQVASDTHEIQTFTIDRNWKNGSKGNVSENRSRLTRMPVLRRDYESAAARLESPTAEIRQQWRYDEHERWEQ